MGNSGSSLPQYRHHFEDPKVRDLDLSETEVYVIDDRESAEAAEEFLRHKKVLYVDCEGRYFGSSAQKLATVQVATGLDCCLVFHITKYRESLDFLKRLFESDDVQKVFHDCSGDSAVLYYEHGIRLNYLSVDDTQVAHKVIQSRMNHQAIDQTTGRSLAALYLHYCRERIPGNKRRKRDPYPGGNVWTDRPWLDDGMIKYAVVDVLATCKIFAEQKRWFYNDSEYRKLVKKQLEVKIKFPENVGQSTSTKESQSFNWGLFAAGAAATVVLGVAVAASMEDKKKKTSKQKSTDDEKKDECTIS